MNEAEKGGAPEDEVPPVVGAPAAVKGVEEEGLVILSTKLFICCKSCAFWSTASLSSWCRSQVKSASCISLFSTSTGQH